MNAESERLIQTSENKERQNTYQNMGDTMSFSRRSPDFAQHKNNNETMGTYTTNTEAL